MGYTNLHFTYLKFYLLTYCDNQLLATLGSDVCQ